MVDQIGPRPPLQLHPQLTTNETQPKIELSKSESGLEKVVKAIQIAGVRLTRLLPFSSRGLIINIIRTPFRLIQSLGLGLADLVKQKSIKAFGSTFVKEMSNYMKKDWSGGIQDFYTDLRSPSNKELGRQVAKENLHYANYMYNGYLKKKDAIENAPEYESVKSTGIPIPQDIDQVPADVKARLEAIDKEFTAQGFEKDNNGTYFHQVTGIMFNLVYDVDKKEVVVCFWGLGNEKNLDLITASEPNFENIGPGERRDVMSQWDRALKDEEYMKFITTPEPNLENVQPSGKQAIINQLVAYRKDEKKAQKIMKNVGMESAKAAVADFIGGIQPSALQAVEIGRILKEATKGSDITPVAIGHSHGGGLAQCAAAGNGIKGVLFNPRPMGAGMRRLIGQDKVFENAKNIIAFSGEGDFLTSNRLINILAIGFERLTGIPVPRTIGQGFKLPKAPKPTEEEQAAYTKLWVDAGYPEGPPRPLRVNQHVHFVKQLRELVRK